MYIIVNDFGPQRITLPGALRESLTVRMNTATNTALLLVKSNMEAASLDSEIPLSKSGDYRSQK